MISRTQSANDPSYIFYLSKDIFSYYKVVYILSTILRKAYFINKVERNQVEEEKGQKNKLISRFTILTTKLIGIDEPPSLDIRDLVKQQYTNKTKVK